MSNRIQNECIGYFQGQQGFRRCFLEMRKKWKSYGKAAGRIKIKSASEEEKRAIGNFLGRKYWDGDVEFDFADFEKALQETKFREVPLIVLLEGYFGEKLVTNQNQRERKEQERAEFWNHITASLEEKGEGALAALRWVLRMQETKQHGYGVVMGLWKSNGEAAEILVHNVCEALAMVFGEKGEGIPLAVLAARTTGNPHYFDRGQNAALLLLHGVCVWEDRELPRDAPGVQRVYRDAGIITDEVASTVVVRQLHLWKKGRQYEVLEALNRVKEPGILSLANLADAEKAWAEGGRAYVVENEMVFSYLEKHFQVAPVTLLCTSGQPSCAAQRLIKLLCENNIEIYYSGDMDPEGLGIADRLWRKYPQNIHIWRMDGQDYLDGLSEETIEAWRLNKMQGIENDELKETAARIRKVGRAAYQENILEKLVQDISGAVSQTEPAICIT